MQQTFPAAIGRRISIASIAGDLKVRGCDQQIISVTSDGDIGLLQSEGDVVMIHECEDTLELVVPYEQVITARDIDGDISAEHVRQIELYEVNGNVSLKAITGEVRLGHINGDLLVEEVPQVHARGNINGEVTCSRVKRLEISIVGGGLTVKESAEASFSNVAGDVDISSTLTIRGGHIGGDCHMQGNGDSVVILQTIGQHLNVSGVATLQVQDVGKDCQVHDSGRAELMLGHVGMNLVVAGASLIRARNIGCDCSLRDIEGNISVDHVGSAVTVTGVAGNLHMGNIGGNAELKGIRGLLGVGSVGGNVFVEAGFPPESVTRLRAGGNVHLILPHDANLAIQATVGGVVHHGHTAESAMGTHVMQVYGTGAARLEVSAGGNLELYGDQTPRSTSASSWNWDNFAHDWQSQWQDMAGQWNNASAEFATSFGASLADGFTHAAKRQQQKAEQYKQKAEKQARRATRMNIRLNNRAWRVDPQRIDCIVEQAQKAASEGVQGAMEAVEQALKNLHVTAPLPSQPPQPPVSPYAPPVPGMPEESPQGWKTSQDAVRLQGSLTPSDTSTRAEAPANFEQERIAILRMVADGRITPEEGDMLLEAL